MRESASQVLNEVGKAEAIKVALSVPVMVGRELHSVLFFDNFNAVDAFDQEALEMAQIFGAQIGVVLQRLAAQRSAERWGARSAARLGGLERSLGGLHRRDLLSAL